MSEKAFLVDSTKCIGCGACQVACKELNDLPSEKRDFFEGTELTVLKNFSAQTWCRVVFNKFKPEMQDKVNWNIMHQKCNHCRDANCFRVCPTKAIYKVDGWTLIDQDKCIGCKACVTSCTYNAVHVSEKSYGNVIQKAKAYKCHGCQLYKNSLPACVEVCPVNALIYDYRLKLIKYAKKRLNQVKKDFKKSSIYGLTEYNGLNVITILKDNPRIFGLPSNKKVVKVKNSEDARSLYSVLSLFSFGSNFIKRGLYRFSKYISG
jgi:formate dehydrogenase iron-sulfur subunit